MNNSQYDQFKICKIKMKILWSSVLCRVGTRVAPLVPHFGNLSDTNVFSKPIPVGSSRVKTTLVTLS